MEKIIRNDDWSELKKELLTPMKRAEIEMRTTIISSIINARKNSGISQKQLELLSGVKQPIIARMERSVTDPQLSTVLKVLEPLGKTLAVVDLQDNNEKQTKIVK